LRSFGRIKFKTIAAIAQIEIGEPSKYWTICGVALTSDWGIMMMAIQIIIGIPIMYISRSSCCRVRKTFRPLSMMVAQMMAKMPPITGAGIADRKAASLLKNPKMINQMPAEMKTFLLATPVIETMPALVA